MHCMPAGVEIEAPHTDVASDRQVVPGVRSNIRTTISARSFGGSVLMVSLGLLGHRMALRLRSPPASGVRNADTPSCHSPAAPPLARPTARLKRLTSLCRSSPPHLLGCPTYHWIVKLVVRVSRSATWLRGSSRMGLKPDLSLFWGASQEG